MVQLLLRGAAGRGTRFWAGLGVVLCLLTPGWAVKVRESPAEPAPPDLLLEGGRKLHYERSFSSEKEVEGKRGFFKKLVDIRSASRNTRIWCAPTASPSIRGDGQL